MKKSKIVRCRLHTGGRSIDDLRKRYTGDGLTYREYESLKRAFDLFDGLEIVLSPKQYPGWTGYRVCWWDGNDEKLMNAVYELEQIHPQPQYKEDRDAFVADWKGGKYDAGMTIVFHTEDVEELRVLQEESDEPDQPTPEKPVLPRWRQVREKRACRKGGRRK